jgi:hypothetical protein
MHRPPEHLYVRSPYPVRVATPADASFVSALIGEDAAPYMARVTTLISDHGFFFLEPITSTVLEAHMQFSSEGRGKEAIHAARAGLRHALTTMGAQVVFGRIPVEDRAARLFTRQIGLRSDGIREREPGGPLVEWFQITREDLSCLPQ